MTCLDETYDDFGRAAYDGQRFANPPVDRYPTVGSMGGMGPGRGMGGGGGYEEEYDYGDRGSGSKLTVPFLFF